MTTGPKDLIDQHEQEMAAANRRTVYTGGPEYMVWRHRCLRYSSGVCNYCHNQARCLRLVGCNGRFFSICWTCLGNLYFAASTFKPSPKSTLGEERK